MNTEITLEQALNKGRELPLSNGKTVIVKQVKLIEMKEMLVHYQKLLEALALFSEYETSDELNDEYVVENLSAVMAKIYAEDGQEYIIKFFSYFVEGITAETLDGCCEQDIHNLWVIIYEDNRRPFVVKRVEMKRLNLFDKIKEVDLESLISYVSSTGLASDTENLDGSQQPTPTA